jgi:hypothetical protein
MENDYSKVETTEQFPGEVVDKTSTRKKRRMFRRIIDIVFCLVTGVISTLSPVNASGLKLRNEVRNSSSPVQMVNKGKSEEIGSVRDFRNKRDKVRRKGRGRSLKENVVIDVEIIDSSSSGVIVFPKSKTTMLAMIPKESKKMFWRNVNVSSPALTSKNVEGIELPQKRLIQYKSETSAFVSNANKFLQNKKDLAKKEFNKNKNQISWVNWVVERFRGGSIADKNSNLNNSDSLLEEKLSRTTLSKLWSLFVENVRPVLIPVLTASILEWMARDRHDREDPPTWAYTKLSWKMKELEKVVNNLEEKTKPAKNLKNIFLWCMLFLFLMLWYLESSFLLSKYSRENSFYLTSLEIANSLLVRVVFFRDYKEYNQIPVTLRKDYDQLIEDISKYYQFVKNYKKNLSQQ